LVTKHNLRNKPSRIFNVDETGIATEHSPPTVLDHPVTDISPSDPGAASFKNASLHRLPGKM
jgi:hypothetical protein